MSVTRGQCDARPTVTFPATRHHRPLASTKYGSELLGDSVNNLPRVAVDSGRSGFEPATC